MDAVEFIRTRNRMCKSYTCCSGCPLDGRVCGNLPDVDAGEIVPIVEQWAKEHPIKTRQSVFLEQWPEAALDKWGAIDICPADLFENYRKLPTGEVVSCIYVDKDIDCADCRREFWMQEVE